MTLSIQNNDIYIEYRNKKFKIEKNKDNIPMFNIFEESITPSILKDLMKIIQKSVIKINQNLSFYIDDLDKIKFIEEKTLKISIMMN